MKNPKILFAVRNVNGRFGYMSDGIDLPEFYELIRQREDGRSVLPDYSVVIDVLHTVHRNLLDDALKSKSNALYNLWQETMSYEEPQIKSSRCLTLTDKANDLINELQLRIQKDEYSFTSDGNALRVINVITRDADTYIDALLCYIHSKANLDISSFRRDVVLHAYADFLLELSRRLYNRIIRQDQRFNFDDSFLKYVAFERPLELQSFLDLEQREDSPQAFRAKLVETAKVDVYTTSGSPGYPPTRYREARIEYDEFTWDTTQSAQKLRDLFLKARSIRRFLDRLSKGEVMWDGSESARDSLNELIVVDEKYSRLFL